MRYTVNDRLVLMRPPEGPLAAFIRPFSDWVVKQGYRLDSLRQRVRIAGDFSRWLGRRALQAPNIRAEHCAQYLRCRRRRRKLGRGDAVALGQFRNYLFKHGVIPPARIDSRQLHARPAMRARVRTVSSRRAAAQHRTILNYVPFVGEFLKDRFGTDQLICHSCVPGILSDSSDDRRRVFT